MDEVWKDIKGYEGYYQISNFGNIRSLDRWINNHGTLVFRMGKILSPSKSGPGYLQIAFYVDGKTQKKYIHRLVMEAFNPTDNPELEINHIDENKENNMITNLEWVTHKENMNKVSKYIMAREHKEAKMKEAIPRKHKKARMKEAIPRKRNKAKPKFQTSRVKRTSRIPPKEVLEKQLFECKNFVALGKLYGVTDNAVRKWCRRYGLPDHTRQLKNLS